MERCETCRWWGFTDADPKWNPVTVQGRHKLCGGVPHDSEGAIGWDGGDHDWLSRSQQIERAHDAKELLEAPAVAQDGSGYKAELWTLPTFGCSLHALREAGR